MSQPSIPDNVHAKCPVCGSGSDYPAADLTSADAQTNISAERVKQTLVWFEGELMCEVCKQNRINRNQSDEVAERCGEEQEFRDAAGFKRIIT